MAQAYVPVSPDGTNFTDNAPLGSPEQKGLPASVEAGQLSRALTIAELNVLKDAGSQDVTCACLAGRSELAFMNVGYQIKPIYANAMGGVAPATGSLPGTTNIGGNSLIQDAIKAGTPITDEQYRSALGGAGYLKKIDEFLYNLYTALDGPHQELEAALRGETLNLTFPTPEEIRFGTVGSPESELTAPFNPANRLAVGDPKAFAEQANSAKSDLAANWKGFGDKLKANTTKVKLEGELALAQKELAATQAQIATLKKQQAAIDGGAKVAHLKGTKSVKEQIDDLEKEAAKLEQQTKDLNTQISQLPPPG